MNNQGFNLIELMITVAILSILTAVAIPAYTGYVTAAKMTEAKNNIAALKLAEEEYFLEKNTYFFKDGTNAQLSAQSGGLWSAKPGDDGINFTYKVEVSGSHYKITATGNSGTKVAGETVTYTKQ